MVVRSNATPLRFDPERVEVVIKQKASRVIPGPTLTIFVALMVIAAAIMAAPNMYEAFNTYVDRLEDIGRARNYKKAFKNSQHKESMLIVKKLSEFKVSSIEAVSKFIGVAPAAIGGVGNFVTSGINTGVGSVKDVLTVIQIGTKSLSIAASLLGPTILACIMILLTLRHLGLPVNKVFESSVSTAMKGGKITIESLAKVFTNLTKVANKRDMNNAMVKSEGKVVNLNTAAKTIQNAWRAKKRRRNNAATAKLNVLANVASNQMKNRQPINKTKLNFLMNAALKSLND
jgi:hypothetical protein|tara:strand:- start:57 stop:920 length:864 start_codon:yes stop_codon:yes gene_type:complete